MNILIFILYFGFPWFTTYSPTCLLKSSPTPSIAPNETKHESFHIIQMETSVPCVFKMIGRSVGFDPETGDWCFRQGRNDRTVYRPESRSGPPDFMSDHTRPPSTLTEADNIWPAICHPWGRQGGGWPDIGRFYCLEGRTDVRRPPSTCMFSSSISSHIWGKTGDITGRKPGSDEEITFYVVFTGDWAKLRG